MMFSSFYIYGLDSLDSSLNGIDGVNLERGYVADEDTSIYNPGLSLLTESEKERLIEAIIDNRKGNMKAKTWNKDLTSMLSNF